jgi:hypothetical protein
VLAGVRIDPYNSPIVDIDPLADPDEKMSDPTPVSVIIDDRLRLMATALAATTFPQSAQERKRHHAHSHARATVKHLQEREMSKHPAIVALQALLDSGTQIDALFTLAMQFSWPALDVTGELPAWMPENFNGLLRDFYEKGEVAAIWESGAKAWEAAEQQAKRVFEKVYFKDVLIPFVGEISESFYFMPNILYPADQETGIRVDGKLISIVPPPLAWGESPPWPYDEDTRLAEHTYPAALSQYARLLMLAYFRAHAEKVTEASEKELPVDDIIKAQYPTWQEQFIALFKSAVVAIYLEDFISPTESRGFMLMEKRVRSMTMLPGTVSVLRRFLQEKGNRYHTLAEFLTVFPTQLRVARKIVTL